MFGIGAFARVGQVSVRTLHHYDDLGLLTPAEVDPETGYRWYAADQLPTLNRIVALRDLGFPLADIAGLLDEPVDVEQLRGMLLLRRAETRRRVDEETERLARVEARIRLLEKEDQMPVYDIVIKSVPDQRVIALRDRSPGFGPALGPILGRLYGRLHAELARGRVVQSGPALAIYDDSGDADLPVAVAAALPVPPDAVVSDEVEDLMLRGFPKAATTVHRGSMDGIDEPIAAVLRWLDASGERVAGYAREVYLECDGPQDTWVTELQFPLVADGAHGDRGPDKRRDPRMDR